MTFAQRLRFFTLMLALGGTAAAVFLVAQTGGSPAWGVLIVSGILMIFAAALSFADQNVQFFGNNQQGLRELRSTGKVVPAHVLAVTTGGQE